MERDPPQVPPAAFIGFTSRRKRKNTQKMRGACTLYRVPRVDGNIVNQDAPRKATQNSLKHVFQGGTESLRRVARIRS